MAPFSTTERKKKTKGDRRATEIALIIRQTFESAIMTSLFPRSQIDIFVQIIQADGGTRCASINAATLALIDAGIPIRDFVCSCAAGYLDGQPILDLNYFEDAGGGPDLPVAYMPTLDKISLLQMDSKLPIEQFDRVFKLGLQGCKTIHEILKQAVQEHSLNLLESRSTGGS